MIVFELISLGVALALMAGFAVARRWEEDGTGRGRAHALMVALVVTLAGMAALHAVSFDFVLAPVAAGLMAAMLIEASRDVRTWVGERSRATVIYGAAIVLLIGLVQILNPPAGLFVVGAALVVAGTWRAWEGRGAWRVAGGAVLLVLLALATDAVPSAVLGRLPTWTDDLFPILSMVWALAATVLIGRALIPILSAESRPPLSSIAARVALAALLAWSLDYQIRSLLAWDAMTDGLGGIAMAQAIGWGAIATAMLWAWTRANPARATATGLAFAAVVLVAAQIPLFQGLGADPVAMTAARAEQVNQAVLRYYAENGRYPGALVELSPRYLWHIPEPIMIPNVSWCYEGDAGHYRLGYVYHLSFGFRGTVRVQAEAGDAGGSSWACEEEAAQYNAQPYLHD